MRIKILVTALMAGAVIMTSAAVPGRAAQMPQTAKPAMADKMKAADAMAAKCQAMMTEHEKMMADMRAADERLDSLVATMSTATGMEKPVATAAVVTEMVTQNRTMRDGMMKMQQAMMGHMMEHMQAGPASMASCPLMKHMGDMKH